MKSFYFFAASARTRGMAKVAKIFEIITKAVPNIRQSRSQKKIGWPVNDRETASARHTFSKSRCPRHLQSILEPI
jgi:hypothetical protein